MKKNFLFLAAMAVFFTAIGQPLTGIKTIPGSYPTIATAITDLNNFGVGSGGVTFNIACGYTESITTPLLITATGTVSDPVVFQKDHSTIGPNPVVSRNDAGSVATSVLGGQGDAIFIIQGSDYITFDAIDVVSGNKDIEYGYYLRKVSGLDGCKFVTIKNAAITMTKGNSPFVVGIYSSNNVPSSLPGSASGVAVTSTGGRNENISMTGNNINNVFAGIVLRGYNHISSPYDFQDQNNTTGAANAGNTIQNYGGNVASASYGVYLIYQTSPTVSYNLIDNAGNGGTSAIGTLYGIFMSNSNAGGNMVFNNNNITLSQGTGSLANCIHIAPAGTTATVNNNTFSYGAFASTSTSYLIFCSNTTSNVTIDGNSTTGAINKTGAGELECFFSNGAATGGTVTITNNNFSNITLTGASSFYGIRLNSSTSEVENISNNVISNISGGSSPMFGVYQGFGATGSMVNGNTVSGLTGSGPIHGIVLGISTGPLSLSVGSNRINGLHTSGLSVYGIHNLLGTSNNIHGNKICDLVCSNTNGVVYGIYLAGGITANVYNNYMTGLQCTNANAAIPLVGIYVSGVTNANVFFNTVNLYALSSGALFGSAALYASTTSNLDMRNNILVNKSTPNGAAGYSVAYRRDGVSLATYSINSNANDYYVWNSGPQYLIYYDGVNGDQGIAAFQARVGPTRDNISFSEDPPFSGTPSGCNPHMETTIPTLCEGGGIQITTPFPVTDDIEGDPRLSPPDVGCDEFDGISPLSCFPPTGINVTFTNLTSVVISWNAAVPNPGLGYDYEVRISGTPGSGPDGLFISGSTMSLSIAVTGLPANTTFYAYLRSHCRTLIFSPWTSGYQFMTAQQVIMTGSVTTPSGLPPSPGDLFIIATQHCNTSVVQTIANGGIQYEVENNVGIYRVFDFPGHPIQTGEMVDVTFYDGTNFRPAEVLMPAVLPTTINVQVVVNVFATLQKTDWVTMAIPPNKTLRVHWNNVQWPYNGTGGCGNTDIQQWNGSSWYLPVYSPWNFNPDSTIREITNNTADYIFKRFHCDDGYGFTLDFTIVPSTGQTSPSNPQDFALLNVGGRDGYSCEFGNIIAPSHAFSYLPGAELQNFPSRLGTDGVQNLTIQFESYDNIFWGDMDMMIDLVNVTQPGTLELYLPDATIPLTSATINAVDHVVHFLPGGILFPGMHTMTLSATGGLSMGIDCFNFTSMVPAPVLPTVITAPVTSITPGSAMSGGNVTHDGGALVTARGVCWSTLPAPTLADSHTIDGSGLGIFTSFISPLLQNTQYYVRAYATNTVGTAYGNEYAFMTLPMTVITGTISDSLGISPPPENIYIVAHTACNPNDTLSTLNGGITYIGGGGGGAGTYVVHCNRFINLPPPGDQVFIAFYNTATLEFAPEMVEIAPGPVTTFNSTIRIVRHVHLPYKTASVRVMIPPHRTLQIHYTYVNGCGNTDVFQWSFSRWVKFKQWNWNHYCMWRYIQNNTNVPKVYTIHNDNGDIWFDMMFNCPVNPVTTPSNNNAFALVNMGWRDRPHNSCEFGNIVAVNYTYFDYEGAYLDQFPSRLGPDGVQNLSIQFESYNNIFWNDMNLMIDLVNVTQPGTLVLNIPDASIPVTTAIINPGDTVCYFHTGGILSPGFHTMTLSTIVGLSIGIDGLIYTTNVPIPNLPTVTTAPVNLITQNSAMSGGNVTSDGGAFVTSRGVCWNTTPAPTLLDNFTADGSGLGTFVSLMSPLMPSTSYYVRAYATNLAGTAYGEELMFSTLALVPEFRTVQNVTVASGQSVCYDATNTITVAGDDTYFIVEPTGSAIFAAGMKISFLPHTWIQPEGYMHAYIDSSGLYCNLIKQSDGVVSVVEEIIAKAQYPLFSIYPNPTTGTFTIEQKGEKFYAKLTVEIYNMRGEVVMTTLMAGERKHEFEFFNAPAGLYVVKVLSDDYVEIIKLIKSH